MKKLIYIVLFILLLVGQALASNNASDFLRTGMSARAIAMGSAYTAVASRIDAVFFNPAGLSCSVEKNELTSSFVNNFEEVARRNIGYAVRCSSFGLAHDAVLAFNLSDSRISDIPRTEWQDERPLTTGSFDSVQMNQTLTYSAALNWYTHWGLNVRHYSQVIDRYSSEAWGADIGLLYRLPSYYFGHSIVLGTTLHNIGNTSIAWSTGHIDSMPMRLNAGVAAYGALFARTYVTSFELGFEGQNKTTFHSGIEYWLLPDMFALRCGTDDGAFTIGTGLSYAGFTVDYAQADHKELGVIQRLSMNVQF